MKRIVFLLVCVGFFSMVFSSTVQAKEVTVWYPGWGNNGISDYDSLKNNASTVNEVNPFWYKLDVDGTIKPYEWAGEQRLIDLANQNNIRIRPLISNEFDPDRVHKVLATYSTREQHAQAITDLVVQNNYQGIDIDYELLRAEDSDEFVDFLRILKEKLHANNKRLSVAVMPKPNGNIHHGHDYAGIGKYADQVKIMTYDLHWNGSFAGHSATPIWIDYVLNYAESQIAPHKIRMGLPFYSREWIGTSSKDMVWRDIRSIVLRYKPEIKVDPISKERHFTYVQSDGIKREVWFQTNQSIDLKLKTLVNKHPRIGGISIWHIGGETTNYWTPIRNRLNK